MPVSAWTEIAMSAGALVAIARLARRPLELLACRNALFDEATRLSAKLAELRTSAADAANSDQQTITALTARIASLDGVAAERDRWKAEVDRLSHETANLSEKLSTIRAKGKRVVADRDR
jgi:hypothetical protein